MHDDTNIPEELAAIYLCISVSDLAGYRKPAKSDKPGSGKEAKKVTDKGGGNASPPRLKMIKLIRQGAVGQNQKTIYKLGHLREFRDLNVVESSFEAAVKAGLYGHVTIRAPFFVAPSERSDRARPILIGNAWDQTHPCWAIRFKELFDRKLEVVWMTNSEAAKCTWKSLDDHKFVAKTYIKLLNSEASEVESALEGAESGLKVQNSSLEEGSAGSQSQKEFPRNSKDGSRKIILKVRSFVGRTYASQTGTIGIKGLLRKYNFFYNAAGNEWVKSIAHEQFELDSIKLESWALEAKYVEVQIHDDSGTLLASYEIHKGQWAVVLDNWNLMMPSLP
jgi:hypothetical protein